jgi:hypothetical protein
MDGKMKFDKKTIAGTVLLSVVLECVLNHANHMTVDTRSSIEK